LVRETLVAFQVGVFNPWYSGVNKTLNMYISTGNVHNIEQFKNFNKVSNLESKKYSEK